MVDLDAVRGVVAEVLAVHEGRVSTHFPDCYQYHAGCLAVVLDRMIGAKND